MNKAYFLLIVFLLVTPLGIVKAWDYPANQSGYPYKDSEEDVIDQWNTYTRNCTSYVMWKINSGGMSFNNNPTGPNGISTTMGNAGTWDEHASDIGYIVNETPTIGDPVNWESNSGGAGSAGHVGWVERVNGNGTIFLSEWNWNYGDGLYNERDGVTGDHYLRIVNSGSQSNCSSILNKIVNLGQNFNCTNSSINVYPESRFMEGSTVNLLSN